MDDVVMRQLKIPDVDRWLDVPKPSKSRVIRLRQYALRNDTGILGQHRSKST